MKFPNDAVLDVRDLMQYTPVEYVTDMGNRSARDRTLTEQGLVAACKQSVRWSNNRETTGVGGRLTDDGRGTESGKWTPLSGLDSSRKPTDKRGSDAQLCRLTASEFRRLSEQVKVVNVTNGRMKTAGLKKLHRPDGETSKYRRQFAACLQAFTDKRWLPYEHERDDTPMRRRCRPASTGSTALRELVCSPISQLSTRGASAGRLTTTATIGAQQKRQTPRVADMAEVTSSQIPRPVSCPATRSSATAPEVGNRNNNTCTNNTCTNNRLHSFDSLTPIVLYKLSDGAQPQSVYGSRPVSVLLNDDNAEDSDSAEVIPAVDSEAAPYDTAMAEMKGEPNTNEVGDASLTGGLSSSSSSSSSSGESDSEDDPEDERPPEPTLAEVQLNKMPQLQLRPERLEALDVPVLPRGDRRKYDFDARVVDPAPAYVFADPLTFGQTTVDLAELEANDLNWRTSVKRPVTREAAGWLDRLQHIEHLQRRTAEAEDAKARCRSGGRSRRVQGTTSSRAPSTSSGKLACCADCLQAACVGDCPGKQTLPAGACLLCREIGCDGHCAENVYNVHSRRDPRADDDSSGGGCGGKKTKQRPLSSVSSARQQPPPFRSNRGPVNANGARSKSVGVTFTRGQQPTRSVSSQRTSVDPAASGARLEKDFARLDIAGSLRTQAQNAESPASASPVRLSIVGLRSTASPTGSFQQAQLLRSRAASTRQRHRPKGRSSIIPGKSYFSQKRDSLSATAQCDVVKCRLNRHARHARKKRGKTST